MTTFYYVFFRAYLISFTHDESLSYKIIEGNTDLLNTANHHHLNTALLSLIKQLFGSSEIALRTPNLMAFVIFLLTSYYLVRKSKNILLYSFGLILLLFNPFLLEFFALARGYGLSMAFLLLSIYFLIRNSYNYTDYTVFFKDYFISILFASLALYSNLAIINYFICLLGIFAIRFFFFPKDKANYKPFLQYIGISLASLIPIYLGIKRLLFLKSQNQLYFGTSSFELTLDSLIMSSNYTKGTNIYIIPVIKIMLILFIIVGLISIIKKKEFKGPLFIVISVILGITLGLHFEHYLFEAKYPFNRTALVFIPLFSLFGFYFVKHFLNHYKIKLIIYPFLLLIMIPVILNFTTAWNFTHVKSWRFDAHTKEVMQIIKNKIEDNQQESEELTMNCHWVFEPTINYYITSWKLNIKPVLKVKKYPNPDYIYRRKDKSEKSGFQILEKFEDTESNLLINSNN